MKQIIVAALCLAAGSASPLRGGDLARPVSDDFLWVNSEMVEIKGERLPFDSTTLQLDEQLAQKDTRIVPVEFKNAQKSPGIFLRHNFDLMQDCLNANSDEDAWVDAAHAGYKEVPMAHAYGATSLVQLNDPNFEKFDPCEALDPHFRRPVGV